MYEVRSELLRDWMLHPEDFVIIQGTIATSSDIPTIACLIVNIIEMRSYIIEDDQINKAIAEDMIAVGVQVITFQQWRNIFDKNRTER